MLLHAACARDNLNPLALEQYAIPMLHLILTFSSRTQWTNLPQHYMNARTKRVCAKKVNEATSHAVYVGEQLIL
jgi:hypothetical protein